MMKKRLTCIMIAMLGVMIVMTCGNQQDEMTTGMISGIINDSTGGPLDSVLVITDPATSSVYSDETGAYQIPDVQPDEYTVEARKRTYIPGYVDVTVTAGEISTADVTLQQSIRCVVAEMLTTACHCADDARDEMYTIKANLGDRCAYLEYHASCDGGIETWDPFVSAESESRRLFYGADTFLIGEWVYFDGTTVHYTPGSYQNAVDSLSGIFSPLVMNVTGSYSSATGAGTIDLEIIAIDSIAYHDLVVEFGVYDRGPVLYAPDSICVVPFRYLLVAMPSNEALNVTYGQTVHISKTFTVPDSIGGNVPPFYYVDKSNIGVAVFVQSTGSKEVLQAVTLDF
jgi:hypothetical protein